MRTLLENRRAQESGPLQKIFIAVILVCMVAAAATIIIDDLNVNYGYALSTDNISNFTTEYEELANISRDLGDEVSNIDTGWDIIGVVVTGGYKSLIKFLTYVPITANKMVIKVFAALGLGDYTGFFYLIVFTIIIFAIIALIMKVRG